MAINSMANDAMIRRLEKELDEHNTYIQVMVAGAQEQQRDLNKTELESCTEHRNRMEAIGVQLRQLEDTARVAGEVAQRARIVDQAIIDSRGKVTGTVQEYRSAGQYTLDMYRSSRGDRESTERLDLYFRTAAHQKTTDNLGIVPDPIVGEVVNFIDTKRPLVTALGPRPLTNATWYRPLVTQHTATGVQGSAGAAADEKKELVSQKMTITRLTGQAKTIGGYVNVSRQDLDFSQPSILDAIIQDLAGQYAIDTEAAVGDALAAASDASPVVYDPTDGDTVATAIWAATASAYSATAGLGSPLIAISSDVLSIFGPLFAPYGPMNQQGQGFSAASFGQGPMGVISGVPVYMSAGLGAGEAFLFSSAALEVYEQRIGTLQVTEPSVLGLQVAYAGYFTVLEILDAGIIPLTSGSS